MSFLKRKPNRLERLLAADRLQEAMERVEPAIPAGALIATRTGEVAHRKSGLPGEPGARCEAMRQWTDWRIVSDDEGRIQQCEHPG
jgi:hypothetical protein